MFSVDNPKILLLLLILIPIWIFFVLKFRFFRKRISGVYKSDKNHVVSRAIRAAYTKISLRTVAYIFSVLALSGISFGVENVPVQKNGNAVSFVFDISYSMLANDSMRSEGMAMTRLDHAKRFAGSLLSSFRGEAVSVVLAKGDGFVALPLTEDYFSVESLVSSLSPKIMTSKGSSLARGIRAAISSFPKKSARNAFIFVFTDGDETDGLLEGALEESLKLRVPVYFIGFGSEGGAEIVSGDGKPVTTFLRKEKLMTLCDEFNSNNILGAKAYFFDASQKNSLARLLSSLEDSKSEIITYETKSIRRHVFLLMIAVIALILSEIDFSKLRQYYAASSVLLVLLFSSCSEKTAVFSATSDFKREKFRESTGAFLNITTSPKFKDDKLAVSYGIFGLSANYMALGEYDKAMEKLNLLLDSELDGKLKGAVFYNRGIIFVRRGDFPMAIESFKLAVLSDSSNTSAKINLELCSRELSAKKQSSGEQEMKEVMQSDDEAGLQKEIFTLIRNQESNQWRRLSSNEDTSDAIDY